MTWPFWRISNHSDMAALHHALDLGYLWDTRPRAHTHAILISSAHSPCTACCLVLCCLVRLQNHELVLHIRPRTRLRSSVSDRTLQSTSFDWSVTYAAADTNVNGCEQQTAARSSWLLWKEHFVIRACDGTPGITLRVRLRPSVQNIGWYCVYWSCGQNLALYCKLLHYYFI